jgi:UDP-glucuronate 4-epimerase
MSILVTGGAGFIGSHLVERLLADGDDVVALDNFDTFYDPSIKEENLKHARTFETFTEVRGDIRDPELYARLPEGIDTVVHLAARAGVRPSIEDAPLYVDVNIGGTILLLDFMRTRGIRRLVFGSSSSVYGDAASVPFSESDAADRPISPYAATKRAGELLVHSHAHLFGFGAVCLRFFTVYGPRQRPDLAIHKFARMMAAGDEIPMFGDGTSERDYTYITDILDGIQGALGFLTRNPRAYEIVNLGGAHTVSLRYMVAQVASTVGRVPRIAIMDTQPGDVRRTCADVSKAESLFGYRPSVAFSDGIRRFGDWYRKQAVPVQAARRPLAPMASNGTRRQQIMAGALALLFVAGCASGGGQDFDMGGPLPVVTTDSTRIADANRTILTTGSVGLGGVVSPGGVPDEYRIGAQDQVKIDVFGVEAFNGTFRVDAGGAVVLPLIGPIEAAGRTPRELEAGIEARLRETYMKDPHVAVQVVEVLSHGVSVIGAVHRPGVYQIPGRTTLLEVLALAEGLNESAGSSIFVVRRPAGPPAPQDTLTTDFASLLRGPSGDVLEVDLGALLDAGRTEANIEVLPGDIVQVGAAGLVYVVGEVNRPGEFTIPPGAPLTVLQALAMAQGLGRTANAGRAVIVRQAEDGSRHEVPIDLDQVLEGSIPPPAMEERDVLYVPKNGSKAFALGVVNALVGMVTFRGIVR